MSQRKRFLEEKHWAILGKLLAVVGTSIGITLGWFNISDRLNGPSLRAQVVSRTARIRPEIRDFVRSNISPIELSNRLDSAFKGGLSPSNILAKIQNGLLATNETWDRWWLFDVQLHEEYLEVAVENTGGQTAREVRLLLPGAGKAQISENYWDSSATPTNWERSISFGDIRPRGRVYALVWPKERSYFGNNPSIEHAKGNGKVFVPKEFVGWDADLVAWFVNQPTSFQFAMFTVLLSVGASVVLIARRRGYINFRPKADAVTPQKSANPASSSDAADPMD